MTAWYSHYTSKYFYGAVLRIRSYPTPMRNIVMGLKEQKICSLCRRNGTKLKTLSCVHIILQTQIIKHPVMKCGVNTSSMLWWQSSKLGTVFQNRSLFIRHNIRPNINSNLWNRDEIYINIRQPTRIIKTEVTVKDFLSVKRDKTSRATSLVDSEHKTNCQARKSSFFL
jgi:hypothetical protein